MVLTSRLSASASEILAGALQDYARALVVGDSATHGKGTVQQLIDLGSQVQSDPPPKLGALKLTIQQFYRVNGDSTQNRGVASDIVVPSLTEVLATGEKDLEHALAFSQVPPVDHDDLDMVPPGVKEVLKARSAARVKDSKDFAKFVKLAGLCDRFAGATFVPPMEGYVRRMLWALAAEGVIPDDACDDPWGPSLPAEERDSVRRAVRDARGTRVTLP